MDPERRERVKSTGVRTMAGTLLEEEVLFWGLVPSFGGLCEPTCQGFETRGTVVTASPVIRVFGKNQEFRLCLAVTEEDRLECWRLVHEEYLAHGYTKPNAGNIRYSIHDALPDTATFIVKTADETAGTITVFPDSPLGLPADDLYEPELDALREASRLAEIGRLTIHPRYATDRKLLMAIIEIPCLYARCILRASSAVITVNPCHSSFYQRMMLFDVLGEERDYGNVCGAPAVLLNVDLPWQRKVIDWVRGEGARPERLKEARRTVYRSFCSRKEEQRLAVKIRNRRPLPNPSFLARYFVKERPLVKALSSPSRYFFEKCILPLDRLSLARAGYGMVQGEVL